MVIVESYGLAVAMCFVTMLCWGSWANTQKLTTDNWKFQLFYWDYTIGVLILSLVLAFTMGSTGSVGAGFLGKCPSSNGQNNHVGFVRRGCF